METQPKRFTRAINALVQAYFNDTLEPTDTCACAIGNIVAAGYGKRVLRSEEGFLYCEVENNCWPAHFLCGQPSSSPIFRRTVKGLENIAVTGYAMKDLMRIEGAFMKAVSSIKAKLSGDSNYVGLMAAVDTLCEIEGISDATEYKALFVKAA